MRIREADLCGERIRRFLRAPPRYGFRRRGRFAEYTDDPNSIFMTKRPARSRLDET